ncbi:hypothetical protein SH611_19980 [Geminicoccaceae bacterium 1502E]|nr:hypothetical protein [Geminicoccaceae bacterium 1502E]
MLARALLYLGMVLTGVLLLLERPTPMAIAPGELQPEESESAR